MTLAKLTNNYTPSFPFFMDKFLERGLMSDNYADSVSTFPSVNIKETDDDFKIEVAAPGLNKEDFKINFDNGQLIIESVKEETETVNETFTRYEFNYEAFRRSFRVSEKLVDTGNIDAKYNNGVLTVNLPKREEVKPKPAKEITIA